MNFKENESEQKLRGGYYTPEDLATYIATWVMRSNPREILEPSCGDGIFLKAIHNTGRSDDLIFSGFELLEEESYKAQNRARHLNIKNNIRNEDFLGWAIPRLSRNETPFDATLGNPPFIRYQYLSKDAQSKAEAIFKILGLKFTKHTNAWVPFILASIALMKPGSRLGMIIPSEIIHVMHAQSLRTFLGEKCSKLLLIDPEEIWFEDTLQGAVILLAEKKLHPSDHSYGLGIHQVVGKSFLLDDPSELFDSVERINGETVVGKWTKALLSHSEREAYSEICTHKNVCKFKDIAQVDVGIVTGANKFFLVADDVVDTFMLHDYAHPMFGRSEHCPGLIYDEAQHLENTKKGSPTNFIWIKGPINELPSYVRDYIALGEEQNLHKRYKCSVRTPWYTVPSVYSSEIGMLKRCHDTPKLILNKINAYTTDTAYRIRCKTVAPTSLVYNFVNALTSLSAELEGRHYGGGVLELVPSEIEKLQLVLPGETTDSIYELDNLFRKERAAVILERQTSIILGRLGVSNEQQSTLLDAWLKMKNRRQRISSESTS